MKDGGEFQIIPVSDLSDEEMSDMLECSHDDVMNSPDQIMDMLDFANRALWLVGEINRSNSTQIIRKILRWNMDDAGLSADERQPIFIYINSNGGDITGSFALYDVIRASKTPVYGINIGYAFSGAFYMLLACHKRLGTKRSWYMMHRGSGENPGLDHLSSFRAQKQWDAQVEDMYDMITERTTIPRSVAENYMLTDTYFNAKDAKTAGIIDAIIDNIDDILPQERNE